jgi:hypothetical protein
MSTSYAVGQYEQEFVPKRLGMYEVPKSNLAKVYILEINNRNIF